LHVIIFIASSYFYFKISLSNKFNKYYPILLSAVGYSSSQAVVIPF